MSETQSPSQTVAQTHDAHDDRVDQMALSDRVVTIRPASRAPFVDVQELWRFRELAGILAWRDFRVRYKQTAIGVMWVVLQPFITTVVFTIIFGKFAEFPSGDLPYPIYTYSGLLLWTYFAGSLGRASTSLVSNAGLITKVYFPRMLLPAAAVVSPVIDMLFASTILWGMMIYFDVPPVPTLPLALVFVAMTALVSLGVGLWLAAVNVRFRDVPYAVPFVIQTWMFLSPVVYSPANLPEHWQWVYSLNPMTGTIEGFRWAILGSAPPTLGQLALSLGIGLLLVVGGLAFFRRWEPNFADTI